jgi:hypothetical protein
MNNPAAPQAARKGQGHSPARDHAPEVGSWLQAFLAFLLHLAGLFPGEDTPENREAAQALRELQALMARYTRGELTPQDRLPLAPHPRPRLPRAQRRIRLTPGIYAALYFTPRAAIAARARFAQHTRGTPPPITPIFFFGLPGPMPTHAHFVPFS